MNKSVSVKIYHGYGHKHNLVVYGHVFKRRAKTSQIYSNNIFVNIIHLLKLFILKPYPLVNIRLQFFDQTIYNKTEKDGFFKFEWEALHEVEAGWHFVKVEALDENNQVLAANEGKVYVPHITQYAFISDIDDTVMISHSATIGRRLRELFIKNPHTRKTFPDASSHYQQLALSHTEKTQPNPFFYVSSSEWNLYDYLVETFKFNKLPDGAFLLNTLKRWSDLIKTGKTGHEGKLLRVMRILDAFPNQKFIFFGDNSQQDPFIYASIVEKYPKNIEAVYIRNIRPEKENETRELLQKIEAKNVCACLFKNSNEAIEHSKKIGLIQ
jgi:phosphatidate phosphatase APP1